MAQAVSARVNTELRPQLDKLKPEFAAVLPANITPDKMVRCIINAVQGNPKLMQVNRQSLFRSAMTAAILGLEVDDVIGQGYIVPFGQDAVFIPGYKGYITLAKQAGYIVEGHVVRQGDDFSYSYGLTPQCNHYPLAEHQDRGDITYAYATARSHDLPPIFVVLPVARIIEIRNNSNGYKRAVQNGKHTPWKSDFEAMAIKTAIRALASRLPLEVQRAAAIETQYELGKAAYIDPKEPDVVKDQANSQPMDTSTAVQGDLLDEDGNVIKDANDE